MQRKSLSIGLLAAPILVALAGCRGVLPPPPAPEHQGVLLRVACPPALVELIRGQSRAWQGRQQASVETVPPGEKDRADVWILPPDALPARAAPGQLLPVPSTLRDRGNPFNWSGLLPFYREQLLLWGEPAFAVPLLGESPVCLYRADWFADPVRQQEFRTFQKKKSVPVRDLRPPLTWEDFALIAEYFHEHSPSGKPTPSLPPLPAESAALDRLFYTVAVNYARRAVPRDEPAGPEHRDEVFSFHYDLKTGEPRIATPGFVAALQMLQRLQACRPAEAHPHPEEAFRSGHAVLCFTDASAILSMQRTPALRDKVGICVGPGSNRYFTPQGQEKRVKAGVNRIPYLGGAGWLAAVPTSAKHPEAAFDLLADLAGPVRSTQIVLEPRWGAGPIRIDQLSRERWDSFDLDAERSMALKEVLGRTLLNHGLKNPVLCLRIPDAVQQEEILAARVRDALEKKSDPAAALQSVARAWAEWNAKKGKDVHLREYRISLGLLER